MKKSNLSQLQIIASSDNFLRNNSETLRKVSTEMNSLNYIVKVVQRDYFDTLLPLLTSCGLSIKTAKEFTVKFFLDNVASELFKIDENGVKVVSVFRNVYKYDTINVMAKSKNGKWLPVLRNGKQVTAKVAVLDNDGKKIIETQKLCAVNSWSVTTLFTILSQSQAIKSNVMIERVKVAKKATKGSKATKQTAKVKKAKLSATSAAPTTK